MIDRISLLPARIRTKVTLFPRPWTSHCTEFFVRFMPFYLHKDTVRWLEQNFWFQCHFSYFLTAFNYNTLSGLEEKA